MMVILVYWFIYPFSIKTPKNLTIIREVWFFQDLSKGKVVFCVVPIWRPPYKSEHKAAFSLLYTIWTTPCGPAPPSSEKPAMAYTSSENWQKYDIIVLLCKQDCTPSRHYISFVFGLSQHTARPSSNKDKYKFPLSSSVSLGIKPRVTNHPL